MDRRRDKNLIVEPNAAMPGRKYSEEKPWSCKYCYWWGGRKKAALRGSVIICFPQKIKGRKGVVNCRMK